MHLAMATKTRHAVDSIASRFTSILLTTPSLPTMTITSQWAATAKATEVAPWRYKSGLISWILRTLQLNVATTRAVQEGIRKYCFMGSSGVMRRTVLRRSLDMLAQSGPESATAVSFLSTTLQSKSMLYLTIRIYSRRTEWQTASVLRSVQETVPRCVVDRGDYLSSRQRACESVSRTNLTIFLQ